MLYSKFWQMERAQTSADFITHIRFFPTISSLLLNFMYRNAQLEGVGNCVRLRCAEHTLINKVRKKKS